MQGGTDIPLNDAGREQARKLAGFLSEMPIDVIAASTLSRAVDTADAIAALHPMVRVKKLEQLVEMSYGTYEGKTEPHKTGAYAEVTARWAAGETHVRWPGGENPELVASRGLKGLKMIGLFDPAPGLGGIINRHILVAAHSRFNKIVMVRNAHTKRRIESSLPFFAPHFALSHY